MSTEAIAAASQATAAGKSETSRKKLAESLDTFILLLTTQLKHQDPLSPMDSNEFTNQLVQFANVEQQIQANSNLEKLVKNSHMSTAVAYLGTEAEVETGQLPLQGGVARFSYDLKQDAKLVSIAIADEDGVVVKTMLGELKAGEHSVAWDGKNDWNEQLPDGTYKVVVDAVGEDRASTQPATHITGTVTGVASDDEGITLSLGGVEVPLDKVRNIKEIASSQAAA